MKIVERIKNNWKQMLFATAYAILFMFAIANALNINSFVEGNVFSLILLCISLISILSIIGKFVLNLLFKQKANDVVIKASIIVIPIGIIIAIILVLTIIIELPLQIVNDGGLGTILSLFSVIAYPILLIMIAAFVLLITFISFALLRFTIKHMKASICIFIISSILWYVSISNIYLPISLNIGKVNNSQTTFKDIISVMDDSYNLSNTFFMHNGKLYAYIIQNKKYNNYKDEFFCVDFDGNNKKVISNSDKMRMAQFIYIDNNDAYYYTMYTNSINKINLDTGDISVIYKIEVEGRFAINYDEAKEILYDIKPEFKNRENQKYIIDDASYPNEIYARTITLKNINTNEEEKYDNVIHWTLDNSTLYIMCGEEKQSTIYDMSSLKNIKIKAIELK